MASLLDLKSLSHLTPSRRWQRQLAEVRRHASRLRPLSDKSLCEAANDVRELLLADKAYDGTTEGLALASEALRRCAGVELYDVQLMTSLTLSQSAVAEMHTGEGKTFSVAPAAILAVLRGECVHVVTPNAYLAERDFASLRGTYEVLGMSVGLLGDSAAPPVAKRQAYLCEICYGTGYEFGFDYLRDQVANRAASAQPLGTELLRKLQGRERSQDEPLQRGLGFAIIDEIDNVLMDDAMSPLVLCETSSEQAVDGEACRLAHALAARLVAGVDFQIGEAGSIQLSTATVEHIHGPDISVPMKQLQRPWTEYVQQAVRAEHILRRDVHYLLQQQEVRIIDGNTGRVFQDRTWSDGLHQALEAKEQLPISSERSVLANITRQRYFRLYRTLAGTTGTAAGCEREFRSVYGLPVRSIPPRLSCRRETFPARVFRDAAAKWKAIADDTRKMHALGRPILIGTRTIADSETMADQLGQLGLPFQILNGKQDAEEATIIAQAGGLGMITIATNMAGRGTDIKLDDEARRRGGLHVILAEPNDLQRIDRQLIGRCARQGDPGSARLYCCGEDELIKHHGPWLLEPIRRCADRSGELSFDISPRIRSIQSLVEQKQAAVRSALMQQDLARESLLTVRDRYS